MKKFLIKSGIFITLIFAIIGIIVIVTVKFLPVSTDVYNYVHNIKMERLDTLASPRLIIAGGSNVAFGINSERISDSLGLNVQNVGVNASIGLRYVLTEVDARLRKGDVVVIMPEYPQFGWQYNGDAEGSLTDAVFYSNYSGWRKLNNEQLLNIFRGLPFHIKGRFFDLDKYAGRYVYTSRNFNEFGDESVHRDLKPKELEIKKYGPADVNNEFVSDMAGIVRSMEAKGAKVIFIWPISIRTNYNANKEMIREIAEALETYGISFVTPPDYLVEPDSLAFDTPYHMSGPAVEDVTDKLIKCLKAEFVPKDECCR